MEDTSPDALVQAEEPSQASESTIEQEVVETPVEDVSVQDMSDAELDAALDGDVVEVEDSDDKPAEDEPTLDNLYDNQMEDPEAMLDKPIFLKFNGTVHKVESVKELKNLSEQGLSLGNKSRKLSAQTDLMNRLEANGYSQDDLLQLAANHKGEELTQVDPITTQVDDIATGILNSSYADRFAETVSTLPVDVTDEMKANPQLLKDFASEVESGRASRLMSQVKRSMDIQGLDFRRAYQMAMESEEQTQTKMDSRRKSLESQPKNTIGSSASTPDSWKMSDKEFDKYFDNF